MAATANVTVTTDIGPAVQLTSKVFSGVTRINTDLAGEVLSLTLSNGTIIDLDLDSIATVAWTIASNVHTVSFT